MTEAATLAGILGNAYHVGNLLDMLDKHLMDAPTEDGAVPVEHVNWAETLAYAARDLAKRIVADLEVFPDRRAP